MNGKLLTQAMELLAEAETSYSGNGHSYEPEILAEMRNISDRIQDLYDKLKQAYVIIETKKILEDMLEFENKGARGSKKHETVKQLFESIDFGEFICPGGPLKNYMAYINLKRIFSGTPEITIEEAEKRISL